jgi:EAL domain-containing protein (putative c-di-GMP-specific phosphodiesterase class I)
MDEGVSPTCLTVNLSSRQFQSPDLRARISNILEETGLPPECLDIEIPESVAMDNIDNTISRIGELTRMGMHVSIDDFGTGYSSLSQLQRLPIQKLKIDKSFVRDIATSSNDQAIVRAVVLMAHSMNLRVVAEGVEKEDQLSFLREQQCDEAQGFLFSEPLSAEKFLELTRTGS